MAETSTLLDDAVGTETAAAARHFPGPFRVLPSIVRHQSEMFANFLGPRDPWSRVTYAAFLVLIGAWATLVYRTWATWGDLTIDSGHEMYVPAVLSTGKMLYRDIWFMYGPAAPYFNSL